MVPFCPTCGRCGIGHWKTPGDRPGARQTWPMAVNNWTEVEQALWYLQRADDVPHRTEGEQCLLEALSFTEGPIGRVLDIGTGDGRLLDLVRTAYPGITGVGLDFSPPMLERFSERFNG